MVTVAHVIQVELKVKITQIIYFTLINMLILRYKVYKYASILTAQWHKLLSDITISRANFNQ